MDRRRNLMADVVSGGGQVREWKKIATLKKEVDTESWFDVPLNEVFTEFFIVGEFVAPASTNLNILLNGANASCGVNSIGTSKKKATIHINKIADFARFSVGLDDVGIWYKAGFANTCKLNGEITKLQIGSANGKLSTGSNIVVYAR